VLALLGAVACLTAKELRPSPSAVLLGFCLGMAVAIRPTNIAFAGPLFAVAVWRRPSGALVAAIVGLVVLTPFAAYNLATFGSLLGGYGQYAARLKIGGVPAHLAGILVSPSRGLLLYFPATLLFIGLLAANPSALRKDLVLALSSGVVLLTTIVAAWSNWWGGWCFGPRLMTEAQAPMLLVIGMLFPRRPPGTGIAAAGLAIVILVSVLAQAIGTYSQAAADWNALPRSVPMKSRLWDVGDGAVMRALKANLSPASG
jgi:hypothetical protein